MFQGLQGAVFYLKFSYISPLEETPAAPAPAVTGQAAPAPQVALAAVTPSHKIPNRHPGSEYIQLEVFGVEKPGDEITKHFVQMIESKVANSTLDVISSLLARNSTLKLAPADVEFVLPSDQVLFFSFLFFSFLFLSEFL